MKLLATFLLRNLKPKVLFKNNDDADAHLLSELFQNIFKPSERLKWQLMVSSSGV